MVATIAGLAKDEFARRIIREQEKRPSHEAFQHRAVRGWRMEEAEPHQAAEESDFLRRDLVHGRPDARCRGLDQHRVKLGELVHGLELVEVRADGGDARCGTGQVDAGGEGSKGERRDEGGSPARADAQKSNWLQKGTDASRCGEQARVEEEAT